MKFIKLFLFSILTIMIIQVPNVVYAGIVPCGTKANPKQCEICDLAAGINNIMKFFTEILAVATVVVIVIAGVLYIVSAGNTQTVSMAKAAMKNAVIGLVVALSAFLIVHFVILAISDGNGDSAGGGSITTSGMNSENWTFTCN